MTDDAKDPPNTAAATAESELALHELGEILSASAASIRRELERYQSEGGSFQLNDLELELPVKLRIDAIGQLRASVVAEVEDKMALSRLRFRLSHAAPRSSSHPAQAAQNLDDFPQLSAEQRAALARFRIFSAEDLSRAARNAAGHRALQQILGAALDDALLAAEVSTLPNLPPEFSAALVRAGIKSVRDFVKTPAEELASKLTSVVGTAIEADIVANLQKRVRSTP